MDLLLVASMALGLASMVVNSKKSEKDMDKAVERYFEKKGHKK